MVYCLPHIEHSKVNEAEMSSKEKYYRINGGKPLNGEISVSGAKNAITKQLVASVLTSEPCIFHNVPKISEVETVLNILTEIGTSYEWLSRSTLKVRTNKIINTRISQDFQHYNRIPILLIGPLLHRAGRAHVPIPGGCKIGSRPVDFHINALKSMGANIDSNEQYYEASSNSPSGFGLEIPHAKGNGPNLVHINLPYPSVGATENIILSAVLAQGTTVISNAATEPEIWDTISFLKKMGAKIIKEGERNIAVSGVASLRGAEHHTIPDRIETASFASLAIATNGRIFIKNAVEDDLISFLKVFRSIGGGYEPYADGMMFFRSSKNIQPIHIETDVHPGFMTDWQQPMAVALTKAEGLSVIHDTVYENRFGYTESLKKMGADIDLAPFCLGTPCRFQSKRHLHSCVIKGPSKFSGSIINIPDLRAGFAYVIAALISDGESTVTGIEYLERGYAHVPEKLRTLGAQIDIGTN